MSSILLVSPYNELSSIARKISTDENIDLDILDADIVDFTEENKVKELIGKIGKETKVIISRGMLAKVARTNTSIPVVEIPVTIVDILDAIGKVSNKGYKEIAIIYITNMLFSPVDLKSIGDMNLYFIPIEDPLEFSKKSMDSINSKKYDAIIGDALTTIIANQSGIHGILLESNENTVKAALYDAVKIVRQVEEVQASQLKSRRMISEMGWIAKYSFNNILGQSDETRHSIELAKKFAKLDSNILISGETGTGKELFAQSIHNHSDRSYGPFIPVNCSAINESLLESELFGYEAGAFTGSDKEGKKGIFESANKGTVFLDEISETSLSFQGKLLRVLQEKNIRKVGGQKVIAIDARIICTTNKNLSELVKQGLFREDLFYRLNQLELRIETLRARKTDILVLAEYFFKNEIKNQNKYITYSDNSVFYPLMEYDWPGNVRELKNFILKLVVFSESSEIKKSYIEDFIYSNLYGSNKSNPTERSNISRSEGKKEVKLEINVERELKSMESEFYKQLLRYYNGDRKRLCSDYGISRTKLWRKLNQ